MHIVYHVGFPRGDIAKERGISSLIYSTNVIRTFPFVRSSIHNLAGSSLIIPLFVFPRLLSPFKNQGHKRPITSSSLNISSLSNPSPNSLRNHHWVGTSAFFRRIIYSSPVWTPGRCTSDSNEKICSSSRPWATITYPNVGIVINFQPIHLPRF